MVGSELTDIANVPLETQPLPSVPVTVYVIAEAGFALTLEPVVALKPVDGLQVYVLAPDAVTAVGEPLHIGLDIALALTVGKGFTVIATVASL